jgi:hypothetical protein
MSCGVGTLATATDSAGNCGYQERIQIRFPQPAIPEALLRPIKL